MRLSQSSFETPMDINTILLVRNEKRNQRADFPINGKTHPSTILHHQRMRNLKVNEVRFTSKEIIEMLGYSSTEYPARNEIALSNETESPQSTQIPKPTKGI